ncbi:MAG: histidine kinase [Candidatus Devosia symbiotica]|nr:histidine kinase [Candidatus Devosia symbiotica]
MPTLIRLIVTLLFLAGLVYVSMFALVAYVKPTPKQVVIHIPTRDLLSDGAPTLPGSVAPAQNTDEPVSQ